jgi:hypothetical protein
VRSSAGFAPLSRRSSGQGCSSLNFNPMYNGQPRRTKGSFKGTQSLALHSSKRRGITTDRWRWSSHRYLSGLPFSITI